MWWRWRHPIYYQYSLNICSNNIGITFLVFLFWCFFSDCSSGGIEAPIEYYTHWIKHTTKQMNKNYKKAIKFILFSIIFFRLFIAVYFWVYRFFTLCAGYHLLLCSIFFYQKNVYTFFSGYFDSHSMVETNNRLNSYICEIVETKTESFVHKPTGFKFNVSFFHKKKFSWWEKQKEKEETQVTTTKNWLELVFIKFKRRETNLTKIKIISIFVWFLCDFFFVGSFVTNSILSMNNKLRDAEKNRKNTFVHTYTGT